MDELKKVCGIIFAILLLATSAYAVTNETQYVTQGCGNNGDGTAAGCAASPGGVGAFNSWANWEGQNRDLVSQDKNLTATFSGTFTIGELTLDGWTTDATRRIKISGMTIATTGDASPSYGTILNVLDNYVTLSNCSLSKTTGTVSIVLLQASAVNFTVERSVFFHGAAVVVDGGLAAISITGTAGTTAFRNNFFYNTKRTAITYSAVDSETLNFDNNTAYGCGRYGFEIQVDSGTPVFNFYNNLASGNNVDTGFADLSYAPGGGTSNTATNVTSDTSSPQAGGRSKTITFVNAAAGNLHLDPGETDAIDQGTDRSAGGFSDDYDSATRTGTWDVGADEITSSASQALSVLNAMGEL